MRTYSCVYSVRTQTFWFLFNVLETTCAVALGLAACGVTGGLELCVFVPATSPDHSPYCKSKKNTRAARGALCPLRTHTARARLRLSALRTLRTSRQQKK